MNWQLLQQFIAKMGEGWRLYPGAEGVWVLDRPDTGQNLMFTTPEELIAYLREYASTPQPTATPNALQGVQDWFTGLPKGTAPEVPTPKPTTRPPGGPVYPPEKPADWDELMPGYDWQYMYEPDVVDKRELILDSAGKAVSNPDYNRVTSYKPSSRYTSWWAIYTKAKATAPPIAPQTKPSTPNTPGYEWAWDGNQWAEKKIEAKAPAKRPPYAEGPEYSKPDAQGNTWYRSGPDDDWNLLSKSKARTLSEALTDAILADSPDQAEIDRLMGIINEVEASSPNFIANEQQRAFQNRLAMRDQALQEQQSQIELARSPGDWLTWWSMMNRANQPTGEQFRQFGAERFAPQAAGMFQPQAQVAAPATTPQAQMMFAPARNEGYGTAQFQAAQKAVQDEIEARYQAWLAQAQGAMPEGGLTDEILAQARAQIEAQVKKDYPLPETFSGFTGGYGTTNRAIYDEIQRRMAAGEPLNTQAAVSGEARMGEVFTPEQRAMLDAAHPTDRQAYIEGFRRENLQRGTIPPSGTRGGLDWLSVARSGQPIPEPRLAPNIPGVPAFPNPQTWGNLLPSQQEGYKASVEMQGIPFADYWKQYQEQLPKGYVPPGYMFRKQPSYIRR